MCTTIERWQKFKKSWAEIQTETQTRKLFIWMISPSILSRYDLSTLQVLGQSPYFTLYESTNPTETNQIMSTKCFGFCWTVKNQINNTYLSVSMAGSTRWGRVKRAAGGSWRARSDWAGSGFDCTAAQRWSRRTDTAAGLHSERCSEEQTHRTPAAGRIRNSQTPSAPAVTSHRGQTGSEESLRVTALILTLYSCRIEAASLWSEIDSQMFGKDVRL